MFKLSSIEKSQRHHFVNLRTGKSLAKLYLQSRLGSSNVSRAHSAAHPRNSFLTDIIEAP